VDNLELFKLTVKRLNVFYGNRERFMSCVYVDDLVRGIRQAAEHAQTIGRGYFLCDGEPRTWGDYQSHIVSACGGRAFDLNLPEVLVDVAAFFGEIATKVDRKPRLYNRQKAILGKQVAWTCQHARARADFGYEPRVHGRDGLQQTLDWYRSNRWV
jgi:nucleoside-diphosphate-sugar epimerase